MLKSNLKTLGISCIALVLGILAFAPAVHAETRITYYSQPDEVAIFLNNIAFARDTMTLPADSEAELVLPPQVFPDTLILKENGERVKTYRLNHIGDQTLIRWDSPLMAEEREVTLEYLLTGLSWSPLYDMTLSSTDLTQVGFSFFAEIQNNGLTAEGVKVTLVGGRVDTSQSLGAVSTVTTNQMIVGYDQPVSETATAPTGAATIQTLYPPTEMNLTQGETIYTQLLETAAPARRTLIWNAASDLQATVIYKVKNETELPWAEGIVRSYQDDLFIGSDFVEVTPLGAEGSVTVGGLQNLRVSRTQTSTLIDPLRVFDDQTQYEVTLTLTNFSEETLEVEVVDYWLDDAVDFVFSQEPAREANNILRWSVSIAPSEEITLNYQFKRDY